MALVCPADHPVGIGTSYCRLCGRDYITVPDAPEAAAPAPMPVEAPAELSWPELAPAPVVPAQAVSVEMPLVSVLAGPPLTPVFEPPVVQTPVYELPTWAPAEEEPAPAPAPTPVEAFAPPVEVAPLDVPQAEASVETEAPADEAEAAPAKARVAIDRGVVLVATAAGFAGGLVAALGSHALLG